MNMTPTHSTSYTTAEHWRRYLPFLPAWLRLSDDNLPAEDWWPWRGADIHLDRYPVERAPLSVIILHGAGGYGRLLVPYARMLQGQGYEVIAPDLPGYGLSRTPRELISHDRWVDCVVDLVQAERARSNRPVVLFGCSLGGYLAYSAAAKSGAVTGVIATTLADPRLPIVQRQFARFSWLGSLAPHTLPLMDTLCGSLRVPIRCVSRMSAIANDPKLVEVFLSDPYGGGNLVPVHFMRSLFEATPDIEPDQFHLCPVLLAHPAADRWTTVEASLPLFDRIKGEKRLVMLESCGHFPVEEPGVSQLLEAVCEFLEGLCVTAGE
ncbi:alpha/beta hydrolase [Marinobacter zhanjiangensis]|uniref:Esterase n=1 Tax=Marinobacter zhanjiangensis TaxID=578215 RepID=A0ABQ3B0G4_9GAMM|nr:alpha/beta hydrolase [Marinobacter zhanjiangensis]GGY73164.1 esterase [Marinobacter zhanjiangensis]